MLIAALDEPAQRLGGQDGAAAPAVEVGGCALEDFDVETQPAQQQRGGQATDRTADDHGPVAAPVPHEANTSARSPLRRAPDRLVVDRVQRAEDPLFADRARGAELLRPQADPQFLDQPPDVAHVRGRGTVRG